MTNADDRPQPEPQTDHRQELDTPSRAEARLAEAEFFPLDAHALRSGSFSDQKRT